MKAELYTIGYAHLSPRRLRSITVGLNTTVIDCRYRPRLRRAGFSKDQLTRMLGARYAWLGADLGGFGNVSRKGIAALQAMLRRGRNLLLLCAEEAPGDCHRHHAICARYFPSALHIFQDELIQAGELHSRRSQPCRSSSLRVGPREWRSVREGGERVFVLLANEASEESLSR